MLLTYLEAVPKFIKKAFKNIHKRCWRGAIVDFEHAYLQFIIFVGPK